MVNSFHTFSVLLIGLIYGEIVTIENNIKCNDVTGNINKFNGDSVSISQIPEGFCMIISMMHETFVAAIVVLPPGHVVIATARSLKAMDQSADLRQLVLEKLQRNGTLDRIQAELRSAIFLAIEDNDNDETQKDTEDNIIGYSLLYHYLRQKHFLATAAVFCKEIRHAPLPKEELKRHKSRYFLEFLQDEIIFQQYDSINDELRVENIGQVEQSIGKEIHKGISSNMFISQDTKQNSGSSIISSSRSKINEKIPNYNNVNRKLEHISTASSNSSMTSKPDLNKRDSMVDQNKMDILSSIPSHSLNKKSRSQSSSVSKSSERSSLSEQKDTVEQKNNNTDSMEKKTSIHDPGNTNWTANRIGLFGHNGTTNIGSDVSPSPTSSSISSRKPDNNSINQKDAAMQRSTNGPALSSSSSTSSFDMNKKLIRNSKDPKTDTKNQKDEGVVPSLTSSASSIINHIGRMPYSDATKLIDKLPSSKDSTTNTNRSSSQEEDTKLFRRYPSELTGTNTKSGIPVKVNDSRKINESAKLSKLPAIGSLPKLQPKPSTDFFSKHLDDVLKMDSLTGNNSELSHEQS